MARWFVRTTAEERQWEKKHILSQHEKYLATDVLDKIRVDEGYRAKIELLETKLGRPGGLILDIGSNTAGECEYLVTRGYSVIATDINEYALKISSDRCTKFARQSPAYIACDGAALPFADASISCVVFNESLHHIPDPLSALRETARVLETSGRVLMFEPYAYDPWRRISEIRDYFKGTIETSFSERQIRKFLMSAGLDLVELARPVLPPSTVKLASLSASRRFLRTRYYALRRSIPSLLGMVLCIAKKPGPPFRPRSGKRIDELLICPVTGFALRKTRRGYLSTNSDSPIGYPIVDEIPVLIAAERFLLSQIEWSDAMRSGEAKT